jgi:hypothetical protein
MGLSISLLTPPFFVNLNLKNATILLKKTKAVSKDESNA